MPVRLSPAYLCYSAVVGGADSDPNICWNLGCDFGSPGNSSTWIHGTEMHDGPVNRSSMWFTAEW
jgi:hypothetical protein